MVMVVGPEAKEVSHDALVTHHMSSLIQMDVVDGVYHKLEEVRLELVQGR